MPDPLLNVPRFTVAQLVTAITGRPITTVRLRKALRLARVMSFTEFEQVCAQLPEPASQELRTLAAHLPFRG